MKACPHEQRPVHRIDDNDDSPNIERSTSTEASDGCLKLSSSSSHGRHKDFNADNNTKPLALVVEQHHGSTDSNALAQATAFVSRLSPPSRITLSGDAKGKPKSSTPESEDGSSAEDVDDNMPRKEARFPIPTPSPKLTESDDDDATNDATTETEYSEGDIRNATVLATAKPKAEASSRLVEAPEPKRQRRSSRNTNKLSLCDRSSLQFRRFEQLFFSEQEFYEPLKFESFKLRQLHSAPNIYAVDNFLTESDLAYFDSKTKAWQSRFRRSFVDDPETKKTIYDTEHRTSTFLPFTKHQDSRIAAIEERAAKLMGCYSSNFCIEPLQLVQYKRGQFFGVHHDMGDYNDETGEVELPTKSTLVKRRLVTIFCYLNSVKSGGATSFPAASDLKVKPKPGRAVIFSNVTRAGLPDPRTIHAGEPVLEGVKFGLNIWLCEV